jgi:hypothetical protein
MNALRITLVLIVLAATLRAGFFAVATVAPLAHAGERITAALGAK